MNFEFSDDQKQLRDQVRRLLDDMCGSARVRSVMEAADRIDRQIWSQLSEMGLLGIIVPEKWGGTGAGHLEQCVVAEELGRALAPVPFSSSILLAAGLLIDSGRDDLKAAWLPRLASGAAIGTFAHAEAAGATTSGSINATFRHGVLDGIKIPVADGAIADVAIVSARMTDGSVAPFLVDLAGPGVVRQQVRTIDPTRGHARLCFENAPAEPLCDHADGWHAIKRALDRAAVATAFEQVGGADRVLEMARDHALDRMAFGRPIGSFQAIKHMLADMYVSVTLARSNCYYGAWALATDAPDLPEAAATARLSATQAFQHCARNAIQVHGGMGFTWEHDCHLYYRRSNLLAVSLGATPEWEERLIEHLRARRAAA